MGYFRCSNSSGGGSSPLPNYAEGRFQMNGSSAVEVNVGFRPKIIIIYFDGDTLLESNPNMYWVAEATRVASYVNSSWSMVSMGSRYTVSEVTDTGFKYVGYSGATAYRQYVAIG